MDGERAREMKRATTRKFSPTKRQQMALSSSHQDSCSKHHLSVCGNGGGGDVDLLERWKKEGIRGLRGSSSNDDSEMGAGGSDGEEDLRPPHTTTTSISSRKRVRLHGKASDEYNTVDHAAVPRKLRSAINKRSSESISPPVPDVKKKHYHAANRIELPYLNGVRRSKQNMMQEPLTKDEEEVAETLFALARMVPDCKTTGNTIDRISSAEKSKTKTMISASLSGETTKFPFLSTGMESPNVSSRIEVSLEEAVMAETLTQPTVLEQPTTGAGSEKINLVLNSTAQIDLQRTGLFSNNEHVLNSNDAVNPSNSIGVSYDIDPANEVLQCAQGEAPPLQKPDIGLCPVPSAAVENEVQPVKEKTENSSSTIYRKEATLDVQSDLPTTTTTTPREHLTWSSLTESGVLTDSASYHVRHDSIGNDLSTEKLLLVSADKKQSRRKCATHVYISRLIRNYQNAEKKSHWPLPLSDQSKHTEGTKSGVMVASHSVGLKSCMSSISSSGTNCSNKERNQHESGIGVLHDRRILPDPMGATQSGIYSQQKPNCDILSLSAGCESTNPGKGVEYSGRLTVPYLHPLAPHHPLMPFSLPNGCYSSPYPDQLAAVAAQQFQLPHYIANPFYGLQLGNPGSSTKQQQQQIWQDHLTHYRPPPGVPVWQNGRPNDSSPSLIPCTQLSSIIPSPRSIDVRGRGGANHSTSPKQLQLLPIPLFNTPKAKKHYQDQNHHGSYDSSSQLELLCNAQHK